MECNCVRKTTEELLRKSTVRYDSISVNVQIRVLKILYTLTGGPLNFEALGFILSSQYVYLELPE
jgi:hypothetical protein